MSIEAMKQALEALEIEQGAHAYLQLGKADHIEQSIAALRTAIEQAEKQEPVAWTARELELIDGMIRVQLDHAERCDSIANRTMADKQKGWDMERVTLLQKIRATPPAAQRQWVGTTNPERAKLLASIPDVPFEGDWHTRLLDAHEAKLREKNGGQA